MRFVGPPLINSFMEFYGFSEERAREGMRVYRERYGKKGIFEDIDSAGRMILKTENGREVIMAGDVQF